MSGLDLKAAAGNSLTQGARSPHPGKTLPTMYDLSSEYPEVYERYLKVPHYIVYSHHNQTLRYFYLTEGVYQEQSLQPGNCAIWPEDLGIGLGIWQGEFEEIPGNWLRWCDRNGNWYLTDTEQAQTQLLKAAKNLLTTGMSIEQVKTLLELSDEQLHQLKKKGDFCGG